MAALQGTSRLALATALLLFGLSGCMRGPRRAFPRSTDALIVCPGAKQTNWVKFEGTDQLSYQVEVEYPASSVVSCISAQLQEKGWRPLQEDYWNPALPSSHVRGWTNFVDATVHPEATVDTWAAQWENESGDIAWYYLAYRYPPGDRYSLAVHAGLIPANIAKKMPRTPQPASPRMPAAWTTPSALKPSQSNTTPASDDCGLTAYPVSKPTKEILADAPRGGPQPNSSMLAKIAIDAQGKITHLRVLRLAYPEAPFSEEINEQSIDSIKQWHYAPTLYDGKPVAVCSDVSVTIDLGN